LQDLCVAETGVQAGLAVHIISHARQPLRQLRPGCQTRPSVVAKGPHVVQDESDACGKARLPANSHVTFGSPRSARASSATVAPPSLPRFAGDEGECDGPTARDSRASGDF
jgi:hypothetical protein